MKYFKCLILLPLLFACAYPGFLSTSHLPVELRSSHNSRPIYEQERIHFVGPAGINRVFAVFSLSEEAAKNIQKRGLAYLDNLSSTREFQQLASRYSPSPLLEERRAYKKKVQGLYAYWRETPLILANQNSKPDYPVNRWWKQQKNPPSLCKGITVCNFYGDHTSFPSSYRTNEALKDKSLEEINFIDEIEVGWLSVTDKALKTEGNYVGYGEWGVLIVSPLNKQAYFLSRY